MFSDNIEEYKLLFSTIFLYEILLMDGKKK